MLKVIRQIMAVGLLLSFSGLASATLDYDLSWHDHERGGWVWDGKTIDFDFDLGNDGFDSDSHWVDTYAIRLKIWDDERDKWWNPKSYEWAVIDQEGRGGRSYFEADTGYSYFWGTFAGLRSLNNDGTLSAWLTGLGGRFGAGNGDFYVREASLWAFGKEHDVPEPAPIALLGLGLIALTYIRRRKPQL